MVRASTLFSSRRARGARTAVLLGATVSAGLWINLRTMQVTTPPAASTAAPPTEVSTETTLDPAAAVATVAPASAADVSLATAPVATAAPAQLAAAPVPPGSSRWATAAGTAATTVAPVRPPSTPAPTTTPPPPATTPTTTPPPAPTTTTAPAPATTAPAPTTTTTAPRTVAYRTVSFDDVGDVVVADPGDGTLSFTSCSPEPGWRYQVEKRSPTVTVKFTRTSGEGEAKLEIRRRSNGELEVLRER